MVAPFYRTGTTAQSAWPWPHINTGAKSAQFDWRPKATNALSAQLAARRLVANTPGHESLRPLLPVTMAPGCIEARRSLGTFS
jgi:hypothetical protein